MTPVLPLVDDPVAGDPVDTIGSAVPAKAQRTKMPVFEQSEHSDGFVEFFIHREMPK